MGFKIVMLGRRPLIGALNREIRNIKNRTAKGVRKAADRVVADAIPRTPVDLGDLQNSYTVNLNTRSDGITATIQNDKVYAVAQHERLDFKHTTGEAKFLEKAVEATAGEVLMIIQDEVKIR